MKSNDVELSTLLRESKHLSIKQQAHYVWKFSVPGMMAQISNIIMQYIDAAMVGSLGADASASIGLVSTTIWLLGGVLYAVVMGGCVQLAQAVGEGNVEKTKRIVKQSLVITGGFSFILSLIASTISFFLPSWLGADPIIHKDATAYILVYSLFIPSIALKDLCATLLQCSGNLKLPAIFSAIMCALDVIFNFIFIYVCKLGVLGASLGTVLAYLVIGVVLAYFAFFKSPLLKLERKGVKEWFLSSGFFSSFCHISLPMAFEQIAICGAMIVITKVTAPLGSIAIAANSFAITAESLCYMPGYGVAEAATTFVGQSIGAKRKDYARHFAGMTVVIGMIVMSICGCAMYFLCPFVFMFLTPDGNVRALATKVLRIELFAEPLFGASIVTTGALRGAGDTLIPSIMNLISIWGVRVTSAFILAPKYGLVGVWIAMCAELCFRGAILLFRLVFGKWIKHVDD